jgi:hypothetical protein
MKTIKEKFYSIMDETGYCFDHELTLRKAQKKFDKVMKEFGKSPWPKGQQILLVKREKTEKRTLINRACFISVKRP